MLASTGPAFSPRLICIAGDRLMHPADMRNDLARIVVRWSLGWVPETWPARQYFLALGIGDDEEPSCTDQDVVGWRLLEPRATSLAWRVRADEVDVTTALTAEALAWPC